MTTRRSFSLGPATVVRSTDKGLWVHLEDHSTDDFVPYSQIHDNSEVYRSDSKPGELVITEWLANERGWL